MVGVRRRAEVAINQGRYWVVRNRWPREVTSGHWNPCDKEGTLKSHEWKTRACFRGSQTPSEAECMPQKRATWGEGVGTHFPKTAVCEGM